MKKTSEKGFTKRQLIEKSNMSMVVSIIIAAAVLSFSVIILNFLWSLSGHYDRVEAGKSEASKILQQNVDNIEQLQANFNVLEAGDVKASTILDALPSKYDFPALATSMESLVASSGLTLDSFGGSDLENQVLQESTTPTPVEIELTLSVSGSYSDIQKFIDILDRTIRPMNIKSIELKGSDESMRATMSMVTYYQPSTSLEVETRTIE